jgi:hypothetical protein
VREIMVHSCFREEFCEPSLSIQPAMKIQVGSLRDIP